MPAYLVNGQIFVQKFLIEQNLNRFTGGDQAHTLPFLQGLPFYVVVLFVGILPWSLFVWKAWPRPGDATTRFLATWAAVPFIFFTISRAKLPHYILPCCVPLAILVGVYLAAQATRRVRFPILACMVVAVVANTGFIFYYSWFHREIHQLAFYVRDHAGPGEDVASYEMARRPDSAGPKPLINETSHPSLVMYLNREVTEPEDIQALLADPRAVWVLTRQGRITATDVDQSHRAGRELSLVPTPIPQKLYALYFLSPAPGARTRR